MPIAPTSILGGDSDYCINEAQLNEAVRLTESDPDSSEKLKALIAQVESECNRNERCALAFSLFHRLRTATD